MALIGVASRCSSVQVEHELGEPLSILAPPQLGSARRKAGARHSTDELVEWLRPYQALPFPVLATLSDGEEAILAAFRTCWPGARPQRCQSHWLSNVAEPVLKADTQLREQMRQDLGGLPAVPYQAETLVELSTAESDAEMPPFWRLPGMPN